MEATINGRRIAYEVHGTGQPVLFVHGFPLSRAMWGAMVEPMQDDYRLILPDLRGFGESEASEEARMGDYAEDLAALLDQIGETRPVVLVALSMGGYIAFEFFRRYPERVHALALVDTRHQADDAPGRAGRYETAKQVQREGAATLAQGMSEKLFAEAAPDALREQWRARMAATTPQGIVAALHAMAERPDSTETLPTISRPVLIIVGAEDRITPPEVAREMQGLIPGATLEVVPDAGHLVPVEQPQRFTALLLQFLDDLDPVDRQGWPRRPDLPDR